MKKHIPNFITLLNLASGVIAILFATQNQLEYAAYFVFLGIIFDFFDGFFARILNVKSALGLQLDSLADMVTSGVVPGIVLFQLLLNSISNNNMTYYLSHISEIGFVPFLGILITLGAGYRLANFNIDTRQTDSFIGLPTPALTLFVVSLPLIGIYGNYEWAMSLVKDTYFLVIVSILGSILMNVNLPLFSLKFKNFSLKENSLKFIFMAISIILLIGLKVIAIPLIILLYILLSIGSNFWSKTS
jgi:CDP-diacylglycerol--serine O-phosphatidyltransferase